MAIDINVTFDPIPDLPAEAYMALRGLKGDKGDQGEQGEQGESSDVRINGVSIVVDNIADIPLASSEDNGAMSSTDKDKLDGIESGAEANVQSDWNEADSTADDFIKNKPTLFSGDYDDLTNKPTIPSATSDLTNDSGFITLADVPADKVLVVTKSATYAEVLSAYNDGKVIFLKDDNNIVPLTKYNSSATTFFFRGVDATNVLIQHYLSADGWSLNPSSTTLVPTTRTINGKSLGSNITLTASDVGAMPDTDGAFIAVYGTTPYADVLAAYNDGKPIFVKYDGIAYPLARYMNSVQFLFTGFYGEDRSRTFRCDSHGWSMDANARVYVPTTRKINGKALSDDITLTASDVGAPTYTAGTGIDITNGVISLDLSQAEGEEY